MSQNPLATLRHQIIVSVQADPGEPLNQPECLLAMAQSALNGGAKGLRLANPENIRYIKEHLPEVPVIGITKPPHPHADPENHVYITPSLWAAETLAQAGAEIIAMDATLRERPTGDTLEGMVKDLRQRFPHVALMADCATLEDAVNAEKLGFDLISTTLAGYTAETVGRKNPDSPDFALLEQVCKAVKTPVILEGRIWEPAQVTRSFDLGAFAVVIGSAITRPHHITRRFADAIPQLKAL